MSPAQYLEKGALSPHIEQLLEKIFAKYGTEWKERARKEPELFILALLLRMDNLLSRPSGGVRGAVEGALFHLKEAEKILEEESRG